MLEVARQVKNAHFEGTRIFVHQDFSKGTQKNLWALDKARKKLKSIKIQSCVLNYSAILRITRNNATKFFIKP